MIPTTRKHATKRLREPVKDYIAEGGKILASDDDPIFAAKESVATEMPAKAKPVPRVRWRRPILHLPSRPARKAGIPC
jgi:hypothetical protein